MDPEETSGNPSQPPSPESAEGSTPQAAVSDIAATLAQERPEIQPHAIEQAHADAQTQESADRNGELYDPARHTGTKTKTGAWRLKKGAPPKGSTNAQSSASTGSTPSTSKLGNMGATPAPSKEVQARTGGKAAANLLLALCVGLGGDEWHPRIDPKIGLDEKFMLETVFGDYFVATGKADLPPGWALVAGCCMYSLPRFAMPKTKSRLSAIKNWFAAKVIAWRARRAGHRVTVKPENRTHEQTS